ncbi:MAG: DUF494 domain-containing protein [Proteobacteria bacterium]|jgi:Smg protein|nr:DUF494 domain-containing protein [Pseudomonadota bacterium]
MKEDMLEVLLYLVENYMAEGGELQPDQEILSQELSQAGFADGEITKAFAWLEDLLTMCEEAPSTEADWQPQVDHQPAIRIFTDSELLRLGQGGTSLLIQLEQAGVLDSQSREMVIDRVMAIETDELSADHLKWVVMMVLCNHPERADLIGLAEELVSDEFETLLH